MKEYNIGPIRGVFAAAGKWVQSYFYGFLLFRFFSFYPQVYYIIKILQVYIMYNTSFLDGSGGGVVFFEYIII